MSNSGGIIRQPVSIKDVKEVLPSSYNDVGNLAKSNNINKWAWYKPVVISNKVGVITEQERKNVKYGLVPTKNNSLSSVLIDSTTTSTYPTETAFNNAKNDCIEWTYNKPSGTISAPYRQTDFVCNLADGRGDTGYYKDTEPPLMLKTATWNLSWDDLDTISDRVTVDISANTPSKWISTPYMLKESSGNVDSGTVQKDYKIYFMYSFTNYKARFGTASNQNINQPSSYVIPLNWLLGTSDQSLFTDGWRMGFAVFVPAIPSGSQANINPYNYCSFFTSQQALNDTYSDTQEMVNAFSVDLCTNQVLARKMGAYVKYKNMSSWSFDCIPFMVKLPSNDISIRKGTDHRTYQEAHQSFEAYNFPTGESSFKIEVTKNSFDPSEADGWKLQRCYVGMTGEPSSADRRSIFCIAIVDTSGLTRTASFTFYAKFTHSYQNGSTTITDNYEGTVTWNPGQTFTVNNTTYTGVQLLLANRERNIVNIEVFRIVYS